MENKQIDVSGRIQELLLQKNHHQIELLKIDAKLEEIQNLLKPDEVIEETENVH